MKVVQQQSDGSECGNWRSTARREEGTLSRPSGFMNSHKKRTRTVVNPDGTKMKFCPAEACKVFLPLFQFGSNSNMPDGLDTYCVQCNQRKRKEKYGFSNRRHQASTDYFQWGDATIPHHQGMLIHVPESLPSSRMPKLPSVMKRDVIAKLARSIETAQEMLGLGSIPLTPEMLYQKILEGRNMVCEVTGEILTPECFMAHHEVRFMMEDGRLNVKCNRCYVP